MKDLRDLVLEYFNKFNKPVQTEDAYYTEEELILIIKKCLKENKTMDCYTKDEIKEIIGK